MFIGNFALIDLESNKVKTKMSKLNSRLYDPALDQQGKEIKVIYLSFIIIEFIKFD